MMVQMFRRIAYFAAFFILAFPGSIFPEILQGRVLKVDEEQNSIELMWSAFQYRYVPKSIKLVLSPNAQLRGAKSLGEFQTGDEITAEAVRRGMKEWEISRIGRVEPVRM